eukprot:CAMPEP_0119152302 /NCGR_PEP_ID=MMETSP1310-20130426/47582_1 /TAXON_ID=464262 /ORGANISM="Genus nov. species nov., Strain RCC2339" /LENGTH=206 /DNA_ID=CAMNT_0007144653 /DNA_START=36 /DNA_END=653 /DNA_ORIENTATION=+
MSSKRWLQELREGDCIVAFSRREIFDFKRTIERESLGKIAPSVVYGRLPPETRVAQTNLFNTKGNRCKVLIASDAIGMGLNLNIQRVVFSRIEKFDGEEQRTLTAAEAKQIAGRAGRYRSDFPEGLVTTMSKRDQKVIRQLLKQDYEPLPAAGILPSFEQLATVYHATSLASLADIVQVIESHWTLPGDYFMCSSKDFIRVAKLIE